MYECSFKTSSDGLGNNFLLKIYILRALRLVLFSLLQLYRLGVARSVSDKDFSAQIVRRIGCSRNFGPSVLHRQ